MASRVAGWSASSSHCPAAASSSARRATTKGAVDGSAEAAAPQSTIDWTWQFDSSSEQRRSAARAWRPPSSRAAGCCSCCPSTSRGRAGRRPGARRCWQLQPRGFRNGRSEEVEGIRRAAVLRFARAAIRRKPDEDGGDAGAFRYREHAVGAHLDHLDGHRDRRRRAARPAFSACSGESGDEDEVERGRGIRDGNGEHGVDEGTAQEGGGRRGRRRPRELPRCSEEPEPAPKT